MANFESTNLNDSVWIDQSTGDHVSLTWDKIQIEAMTDLARSNRYPELDLSVLQSFWNSAGAVSTFLGTTRDNFEGKIVSSLEYEAYDEMAISCLRELVAKIRARWEVTKVVIQHKLGSCPVGEVSVLIAISSEHRRASLEAVAFAIDDLKANVPIWKKEKYETGDSTWKENKEFVVGQANSEAAV